MVWSVVVAGGGGERFGGPKQFAMLGGRPLVAWAVDAARPVSDGVVLVLPADRLGAAYGADLVVAGGDTRSASVRAGLAQVPAAADVIVVHDGARPLATTALFRSVIDAVVGGGDLVGGEDVAGGADGAVPAVSVADTLKRVEDGRVVDTVPRQGVMAVQTPQAFRARVLRAAHENGGDATDDAGLVERAGATVRVVPGDPRNLKVTTTADLEVVQALAGG